MRFNSVRFCYSSWSIFVDQRITIFCANTALIYFCVIDNCTTLFQCLMLWKLDLSCTKHLWTAKHLMYLSVKIFDSNFVDQTEILRKSDRIFQRWKDYRGLLYIYLQNIVPVLSVLYKILGPDSQKYIWSFILKLL